MSNYAIEGNFVEACDCTAICPCWLDDNPVDDHCSGLVAWQISDAATNQINGVQVAGRIVVSVSTHGGSRRGSGASTVLFVDDQATSEQFEVLSQAFAGELDGPLHDLAAVTGAVLQRDRARIELTDLAANGPWELKVQPAGGAGSELVLANGQPKVFDKETSPLQLGHTALDRELGVSSSTVVAQNGGNLNLRVPTLPGGYLEEKGRSGMTGTFSYRNPPR